MTDPPRFCPFCGARLDAATSTTVEYWCADDTYFALYCGGCDRFFDVLVSARITGPELTFDEEGAVELVVVESA